MARPSLVLRSAPAAAVVLAAVLAVPATVATAVPLSWRTASSGLAGVAGNWNPSQVPAAADTLKFNVGGSYTVTFDAPVPLVTSHLYRSGTVTMTTSTHATSSVIRVGDASGDLASLRFLSGTLNAGNNVLVGNQAGSTGTLRVGDDSADLLQAGTTADVYVGHAGTGTLEILAGGFVDSADDVILGNVAGGQGTATVSSINSGTRSTLSSSGADGDVVVGFNGTGALTVSFGAFVGVADDLRVASRPGSVGDVTVEGNLGAVSSQLVVSGDLELGNNAETPTPSGTASLLVQNFGQVTVSGVTRIGDNDGGTGVLRIRPTGVFTTNNLLAHDTRGQIDFQGGTLVVDGGIFDPPNNVLVADDDQFERLVFRNGASATFTGASPSAYAFVLGEAEEGGFDLQTGSRATLSQGVFSAGLAPGSVGVLNVTGNSVLDGSGTLVLGQGGYGELNLNSGADVTLPEMNLAYLAGSNAFADLASAGTTLTLGRLSVGGTMSAAGGSAFLGVGNGAVVQMGTESAPLRVNAGGTLRVTTGGTVNVPNNLDNFGRVLLAGGQMNIGSFNLQLDGELEGFGTIAGSVAGGSSASIRSSGGALVLGNAASNKGFDNSGTLVVGTGSPVTIRDSDGSNLGNVDLEQAQLTLTTPFGTVQTDRTMSGSGTVQGSLRIAGTIEPGHSAGVIGVQGPLTMLAGGTMRMEIGDAPTNQHDLVSSTAAVALTGTLDIRLLPGFSPSPNELFTLLQCASRTGTFSALRFYGQPVNGQYSIVYNATSVQLRVNDVTTAAPSAPAELPLDLAFATTRGGFELSLPEAGHVAVRLYDVAGRSAGTLYDGAAGPGVLRLPLAGAASGGPPDGVWFARAAVRHGGVERVLTAKTVLVRASP